jgi:hypothetical protein
MKISVNTAAFPGINEERENLGPGREPGDSIKRL